MTGIPRHLCVAVVDDDDTQRRALTRFLRAAGMRAIAYASAEEFQSDLKPPHFDCLVVDVQLAGKSGIELRDQLAAEGVATPVLFVTAYDNPKAREQALAGPCLGYLLKRHSGHEILEAIHHGVSSFGPGS
jgi:FixJ family two-component response regulator